MSRYDVCTPEPQVCEVPEQEPQQCVAPPTSNSQKQEEMENADGGGSSSTKGGPAIPAANPPTAKLDFGQTPVIQTVIPSSQATILANLDLGGSITAKSLNSKNPTTVSNKDVAVGGENGQLSAGADGSISAELSSTLNGIKNSTSLSLKNGIPTVSYGVAGAFGSIKTGVSGNTISFACSPKEIKKIVNGVELTGVISFTVKLTIIPHPKFKTKPKPWYERLYDTIADGVQSVGDFIWDNKEVILVGTAVVAVGAAVVMTGGAAAPALVAVPSDRRLKRDIRRMGLSPSGIPTYQFRYLDSDTLYYGVMAQDLLKAHSHALVIDDDGFYRVQYGCIDVDFYVLEE